MEQKSESSMPLRSSILSISHGQESWQLISQSMTSSQKRRSKIRENLRKLDAFKPSI